MLERLIKSLENSPIVKRGEYNYFIHPITDGVPEVDPALIREVCVALIKVLDLDGVDRIIAAEAMAIPIGIALSLVTDIPVNIVRKKDYHLPGEVAVHQATGYSKGQLYLNGVERGDRVIIVDDVISTGGHGKSPAMGSRVRRGHRERCLFRDKEGRSRHRAELQGTRECGGKRQGARD